MIRAVCRKCDAPVWRFTSGRVWYASAQQGHRNRAAAVCQADGGKHEARRGSVSTR